MRRRNKIGGQFIGYLTEMLKSPAYRVLSLSARRLLSRIEIEHADHGGTENGNLVVTKQDFIDYGIHHKAVAPATREVEALGFTRMRRGRGGNAEHRRPNKFFLTYATGNGPRTLQPTHEWRKIKTIEEAEAIARTARNAKGPRAVQFTQAKKTKSRGRKRGPKSGPEKGPEKAPFSGPEKGSEARGLKRGLLSIFRGGGGGSRTASAPHAEAPAWVPYSQRNIDPQRHSRESLLEYVANVIEDQLHDLDPARVRARQRTQSRLREACLFNPVLHGRGHPLGPLGDSLDDLK